MEGERIFQDEERSPPTKVLVVDEQGQVVICSKTDKARRESGCFEICCAAWPRLPESAFRWHDC